MKPIALILAAGESSRFEPYSYLGHHKSMLTVCGTPILAHVVRQIAEAGLADIVIVINKTNADIKQHLGDGSAFGAKIRYAVQDEPLGQGNAIVAAKAQLVSRSNAKGDTPRDFIVFNPSHIRAAEFIKSLLEAKGDGIDAVLLGRKTKEPWRYGIFRLENERAVEIIEKPAKGSEPSDIKVVGLWYLSADFLETLEATPIEQYQFEAALNTYMKTHNVRVILTQKETYPLKFAWDLLTMTQALLCMQKGSIARDATVHKSVVIDESDGPIVIESGARVFEHSVIRGPAYIGRNATVGNHCVVRESSIEEGTKIGAHLELARSLMMERSQAHSGYIGDSVIGRDCWIGTDFHSANARFDKAHVQVTVKAERIDSGRRKLGVIMGHGVSVGIKSGTMPGVVIGSEAAIGPGAILYENVEPKGKIVTRHDTKNE